MVALKVEIEIAKLNEGFAGLSGSAVRRWATFSQPTAIRSSVRGLFTLAEVGA